MYFDQQSYDIRCDWGLAGLIHLSPSSDAIVIIDVLSFSTCVDIAVANGATVYPYRWRDTSADVYAASRRAIAASRRQGTGYSLSPASLRRIPPGTRLVLPSPNGSSLSLSTGAVHTFAGCLRNADAIAQTLPQYGNRFSLIPAGERWPDGSLRFAVEDLLGAGAIIHHLPGTRSPEAAVAEATCTPPLAEIGFGPIGCHGHTTSGSPISRAPLSRRGSPCSLALRPDISNWNPGCMRK